MNELPQFIDGLPNICGWDEARDEATHRGRDRSVFLHESGIDFGRARGACAVALHMHQPLIPAGGPGRGADPRRDPLVGNLQFMEGSPFDEDRHNAGVYRWCYRRPGEFIPQLVHESKQPRLTLDYTGTLFLGLQQMGAHDVLDALRTVACDPRYRRCVEWLGTTWGHTVAPSTPPQDFRLHVKAWQNHFASLFGLEALSRVRGFVPSELALPNHPDVAYAFVKTLKDCGYQWVIAQEHTVENPNSGWGSPYLHLPNRLVCTNSRGETASITVLIKTRGSDTKIIGHMQLTAQTSCFRYWGQGRWTDYGREISRRALEILTHDF